jgi:hypothetical protein
VFPVDVPEPYLDAEQFYDSVKKYFLDLEAQLSREDQEYQRIVFFHSAGGEVIRVRQIGFQKPNMIHIGGKDGDDNTCIILAHPASVQLILKLVQHEDVDPVGTKGSIGFQVNWIGEVAQKPSQ